MFNFYGSQYVRYPDGHTSWVVWLDVDNYQYCIEFKADGSVFTVFYDLNEVL